jgi:hypothetical protein
MWDRLVLLQILTILKTRLISHYAPTALLLRSAQTKRVALPESL